MIKEAIVKIVNKEDLTYDEAYAVMNAVSYTHLDVYKRQELNREEFRYVVPDFRLNKSFDNLKALSQHQKEKVEFLCNECCWFGCTDRKKCYETVSRKNLGEDCSEHYCTAPDAGQGYLFSKAVSYTHLDVYKRQLDSCDN